MTRAARWRLTQRTQDAREYQRTQQENWLAGWLLSAGLLVVSTIVSVIVTGAK